VAKQKRDDERKGDVAVLDRTGDKTEKPPKYKVLLINDDFTPMYFVIDLLVSVFHKSSAEATRLMLTVHQEGKGIAGVYSREIAETKAMQARQLAKSEDHPLLAQIEPE